MEETETSNKFANILKKLCIDIQLCYEDNEKFLKTSTPSPKSETNYNIRDAFKTVIGDIKCRYDDNEDY